MAVCQGDAPSASEAAFRCSGTLESASSEIVKMIGMTAKPIAKAMTRLLRASYLRPEEAISQRLEIAAEEEALHGGPGVPRDERAEQREGDDEEQLLAGADVLARLEGKELEAGTRRRGRRAGPRAREAASRPSPSG